MSPDRSRRRGGDVGAAVAGLDAARVAIAAETARTYTDACGFGLQADVARTTAKLQQDTLDLTQRLFNGGRSGQREVDQATVLVEQANAQMATFDAERRASLYALAVLTGDTPATVDAAASACMTIPTIAQPIPVGDGQALLARRPDVRAAERTLAAGYGTDRSRNGGALSVDNLARIRRYRGRRHWQSWQERGVQLVGRAADKLEFPV